ncbi:phosphate/phosphite/phosphonate ABC transporter substrate-binding protein [Desulfococcaceae bacterium HSG9]|nr:phosphate/phosphite/phosphonate ABC transporter substrate-binding protein [Desulfococcaceae bacterium HSG9]
MMKKQFVSMAIAVMAITILSAAQSYGGTLLFGVYTSDKPTVMYQKFKSIIDYLQEELQDKGAPTEIKIKIYPAYEAAIDGLAAREYDFARFGPASYIIAKRRAPNIKLLVMEHKKLKKRFNGVFITHKASPLQSIAELKGKTFAFGNRNSTIGRYLSQAEMVKAGVKAGDLMSFRYLGRHDKVALAVSAGNYHAGVVKENTFIKYAQSKNLKTIGKFPNVTKPWVVREGFDERLYLLLQNALLKLKDKKILKNLKQDGFLKADDSDYDFVRQGIDLSKQFGNTE